MYHWQGYLSEALEGASGAAGDESFKDRWSRNRQTGASFTAAAVHATVDTAGQSIAATAAPLSESCA